MAASVPVRKGARVRTLVGIAVAGALLLAACGGDDGDEGASETTQAAGGGETTGSTAAAPTGEPIKVMTQAPVNTQLPPYPNIPEAAKVYEQYINDRGGIDGRPLEVVVCDNRGDPNEGANCARTAVEERVVADVGSFTFDASRLIPILEQNNIAWFGVCCPLVAQEFSSPIAFVLGSLFAGAPGAATRMHEDGCEKPVQVYVDIPAADLGVTAFSNAWKAAGGDPGVLEVVKIPLTAQDYSSQVAQATDGGADCIYGGISDSNWAAWLPAMQSAGADQRLYGLQGNLNSKIVEQFPDQTDGGIVVNSYPNIEGPMWDDYRASLERYDAPDLDWNSLAGLGTWTAFTAFTQIVEGMDGEITNQTFLEAANKATEVDTGGMVPVLDLTQPYTGFGGQFPRIVNRSVFYDVIEDGELRAADDRSYDMTNPIDGKPAA